MRKKNTSSSSSTQKIVVLDDDPTGSQTVHSCLLLTRWDVETLIMALSDDSSPLFFVLTNTRGMSAHRATIVTQQVCHNLQLAFDKLNGKEQMRTDNNKETECSCSTKIPIQPMLIVVSRSDSTLRGHYPIETNVIADTLGPFDAHFLVPAFFEGGRITRESMHYIIKNVGNGDGDNDDNQSSTLIPCHETEFAQDSVFGYTTAYLPEYVEEKTQGTISSDQVIRFSLSDVRGDCTKKLLQLKNNVCCVVDGEIQSDLDHFAKQIQNVMMEHQRRFLFRSGASLLTSLAMLPPQPIPPNNMFQYVRDHSPGIILVGSHVQKTTTQLETLLKLPNIEGVEVNVKRIQRGCEETKMLLEQLLTQITTSHADGKHLVVYTSRQELSFDTQEERLQFGEHVSNCLMEIVQSLPSTIGFLISKGGITSNDVLSKGLKLPTSRVLGQILPGCSVVQCPSNHARFPNLPIVIFPGNVGDDMGLVTVFTRLTSEHQVA